MSANTHHQTSLTVMEFIQLSRCVDEIGTSCFPQAISEFCAGLSGAESVFLTAFFDDQKPIPLYADHTEDDDKEALKLYLDVAYLLDPFYQLYRKKSGDQVVTLRETAPDDFKRSEYYIKFYAAMRLKDECGLMVHIAGAGALFFSFGVRGNGRAINAMRLRTALPLIASLVRRHWTVLSPQRPDGSGRLAAHLEDAFDNFGSSVLSPRESEIVRMILKGHSSKAIAREFDNSPETIKVHRKRVYTKLGVGSQGELLSLFLTALSQMPANETGDPLLFLRS